MSFVWVNFHHVFSWSKLFSYRLLNTHSRWVGWPSDCYHHSIYLLCIALWIGVHRLQHYLFRLWGNIWMDISLFCMIYSLLSFWIYPPSYHIFCSTRIQTICFLYTLIEDFWKTPLFFQTFKSYDNYYLDFLKEKLWLIIFNYIQKFI